MKKILLQTLVWALMTGTLLAAVGALRSCCANPAHAIPEQVLVIEKQWSPYRDRFEFAILCIEADGAIHTEYVDGHTYAVAVPGQIVSIPRSVR